MIRKLTVALAATERDGLKKAAKFKTVARTIAPGEKVTFKLATPKALQKLLGVSQTGNYGELTTFAVTDFQSKHGLKATGIADEATKRALARRSKPPPTGATRRTRSRSSEGRARTPRPPRSSRARTDSGESPRARRASCVPPSIGRLGR